MSSEIYLKSCFKIQCRGFANPRRALDVAKRRQIMVTVFDTWEEVGDSGAEIAILPIGAIEQHGRHLPLGTDWLVAD